MEHYHEGQTNLWMRQSIERAILNGAHTYTEIQEKTGAGTSCGNCRPLVEKIIRETISGLDE